MRLLKDSRLEGLSDYVVASRALEAGGNIWALALFLLSGIYLDIIHVPKTPIQEHILHMPSDVWFVPSRYFNPWRSVCYDITFNTPPPVSAALMVDGAEAARANMPIETLQNISIHHGVISFSLNGNFWERPVSSI
jgi:hypothetical protein